jgi:adenylosuccinate synthase
MNKVDIEPVYKHFTGWQKDITTITAYDALPGEMKNYISYLNGFLGVPVKYISNGPGRDQLVVA